MAVESGDLVAGSEVIIKANKRHVYAYPDPLVGTRGCSFCDLAQTKPWKDNGPEVACKGR